MDENQQGAPSQPPATVTRALREKKKLILEQIMVLMSGYRRDDYANSDLFVRQLEQIFERYPPSVILAATSPVTGLQSRLKFPPTVAEVVDACEAEMRHFERSAMRARQARIERENPEVRREGRETMDELRERYPDLLGKMRQPKSTGMRSLKEIAAECGVTDEQLAAIPNVKKSA